MNIFVKESFGCIWNFYHNSHGICYCKMTDDNISQYNVLIPDGQEDFDVAIDDSDCIHMVYQNNQGDILYANHFDSTWRKTTLLKSKNQKVYPKNFSLKVGKAGLDLLYCIEYSGQKMLVYQAVSEEHSEPNVIDCIKDKFCIGYDSLKNLMVLYYSMTEKGWGIKKYQREEKSWSSFEKVNIPNESKDTFLYIDEDNEIHIVYEKDMSIMEYCKGEKKIVGTGRRPVMFLQNEEIITWESVVDNKVFLKKKKDNVPMVIMSGGFSSPREFGIRYTCYESYLKADCCKGNIINGNVRLYGINNFFAVSKKPPVLPSDNKRDNNALYMDFKKMNIKINQLESIIEGLQRKLERYDEEKINRRLSNLETAVKNKF